ncbi:MAG: hypothetical protein JWO31_4249 [Phycisphaerales bacterium]|nr:hypothetical protein [Phycisphaerales bacterium]
MSSGDTSRSGRLTEGRRIAAGMLASGAKVPAVEAALRGRGLSVADASAAVDRCLAGRAAATAAAGATPERGVRWFRVALGIALTVGGAVAAYVMVAHANEAAVDAGFLGLGTGRAKVWAAPGAGAAFVGLNLLRVELLTWLGFDA